MRVFNDVPFWHRDSVAFFVLIVFLSLCCNGANIDNSLITEVFVWSPIRSVVIRVITKSDDRAPGVRFVNHEY